MRHRRSRLCRELRLFPRGKQREHRGRKAADPAKIAGSKSSWALPPEICWWMKRRSWKRFSGMLLLLLPLIANTPRPYFKTRRRSKKFATKFPFPSTRKSDRAKPASKSSSLAVNWPDANGPGFMSFILRPQRNCPCSNQTTTESLRRPAYIICGSSNRAMKPWAPSSSATPQSRRRMTGGDPPSGGRRNNFHSRNRSCPSHLGGKTRKLFSSSRRTSARPAQPSSDARNGERRVLPDRNGGGTGLPCPNPDFRCSGSDFSAKAIGPTW